MIYFRTGGSNLKKNIALALHLAASVIAVATLLSAQQPAPSAASGMNMTEEQVNDANIQLMRQDIRAERKKVVAANMPLTDTEATKFLACLRSIHRRDGQSKRCSLCSPQGICEEL